MQNWRPLNPWIPCLSHVHLKVDKVEDVIQQLVCQLDGQVKLLSWGGAEDHTPELARGTGNAASPRAAPSWLRWLPTG